MEFRLLWHKTGSDDKYMAEHRFEYLGGRESIWNLWCFLCNQGQKHVEIYNLDGLKQQPHLGIGGLAASV